MKLLEIVHFTLKQQNDLLRRVSMHFAKVARHKFKLDTRRAIGGFTSGEQAKDLIEIYIPIPNTTPYPIVTVTATGSQDFIHEVYDKIMSWPCRFNAACVVQRAPGKKFYWQTGADLCDEVKK